MLEFSSTLLSSQIAYFELLQRAAEATAAKSWLVGGCVRDLLCQRTPLDIDLASDKPEMLASKFAELSDGRLVILDAEHGCWRVVCKGGIFFDFSALRAENIIADLLLRDFTINAMALPISPVAKNYQLLDPMAGETDLRLLILRQTSPQAIADDPARILRAYRLAAELNLTIEKETALILQQSAPLIAKVAPERIMQEWWKICAADGAVTTIKKLAADGTLLAIFPELGPTVDCSHALLTMTNMAELMQPQKLNSLNELFPSCFENKHRRARIIFIALLHDITDAKMAAEITKRLRISRDDADAISKVIKLHPRPLQLAQLFAKDKLTMKTIVQFFDEADVQLPELFLLALADSSANDNDAKLLTTLYPHLMKIYHQQYQPALLHPVINGHQLIENLQLHPGKKMGQLLKQIRLQHISGEITTTAQALAWAREQME